MEEVKRGIASKNFIGTVIAASLLLAAATKFGDWTKNLVANYHAQILLDAMKSNLMIMGMPILAVLPGTTSFVEEVNSGYAKFYLLRTKRRSYLWGKALMTGLSGGLSVAGAALLNYGIYWLMLAPRQAVSEASLWQEFLSRMMYMGLVGAICALLGAALAAWLMSNYMAYIGPFVIYFFLIMMVERYFEQWYCIYPKEWLIPSHNWGTQRWGLTVFLGLLIFMLLLICVQTMERKLWDV